MESQTTSLTIVYSTVNSGAEKTSKLRVTGICEENSLEIDEFPTQGVSNAENVSFDDVITGVLCQKQISRTCTSNYTPQILWGVITCPRYLLLTQQSSYAQGLVMFCFAVVILFYYEFLSNLFIYSYSSGLLHWHWGRRAKEVPLNNMGKSVDPQPQQNNTKHELCEWVFEWTVLSAGGLDKHWFWKWFVVHSLPNLHLNQS